MPAGAAGADRLRPGRGDTARLVPRLRYAPEAALANLANLRNDFDAYGPGGFYDAINVTTGEVSKRYLSLDQGMVMAALGNALGRRRPAQAVLARADGAAGRAADADGGVHRTPTGLRDGRARGQAALRPPRKADWDERIARRTGAAAGAGSLADLGPPSGLRATAGRGQVTLDWSPVADAAGYLVHAADDEDGPFTPLDHGGNDVLAVPHPPYVDTTGERGPDCGGTPSRRCPRCSTTGPLSQAVAAAPEPRGAATVTVRVDAGAIEGRLQRPWRPMIGSEHLSLLLSEDQVGGRPLGAELTEALRLMHEQIGVRRCGPTASSATTCGVYREVDGEPVHDFTGVDRVYDAAPRDRPAAGRRAVLHAARPGRPTRRRPSSRTTRSSRRRTTGTGGPTWSVP